MYVKNVIPSPFVVSRKGRKICDETINNKTKIIRIQLIEFNNRLYWIKRINGIIKDFMEVTPNAKEIIVE